MKLYKLKGLKRKLIADNAASRNKVTFATRMQGMGENLPSGQFLKLALEGIDGASFIAEMDESEARALQVTLSAFLKPHA